MSIKKTSLRKVLMLMFADRPQIVSVLRDDIRKEIAKAAGDNSGGGDFHAPFWFDAKCHVNGEKDLAPATIQRIAANDRRRRLYPKLRDGFLDWWNNKRRWTNEPAESELLNVNGSIDFPQLDCIIKIENLLAMTIGSSANRIIYPYFSEQPILGESAARLGLWALQDSLPQFQTEDLRILDVIRGKSYAASDILFRGDEEVEFIGRYKEILDLWHELWEDYNAA